MGKLLSTILGICVIATGIIFDIELLKYIKAPQYLWILFIVQLVFIILTGISKLEED